MIEKIIVIPPCFTYGDILSIIGLLYFLLKYYNKVYLYIQYDTNINILEYYKYLFVTCPYYNKRIYIIENNEINTILSKSHIGEYHICNTHTANWDTPNYMFYNIPTIDKQFYFNDLNPLFNKLDIEEQYVCSPNAHLPNKTIETNHLMYYKLVGLNNNVRMNFFSYTRDLEKELFYKKELLQKHRIPAEGKYNIINSSGIAVDLSVYKKYAKNDYPIIDIHKATEFPGWLLLLIEHSETIHLIEGSNVNFIYHCQYKNIITLKQPVYFHIWLHNRAWPQFNMNAAWNMMATPILDNWQFIHTNCV